MMIRQPTWLSAVALCFGCLMPLSSYAVDVNFSANLIGNPPCDVSGPDGPDQPIKLAFGEVGITKINGENYRQDFTLTLSCGVGLGNAVALYLEYRGMPASFDEKALQANLPGLGIRLYHEGVIIPPNSGTPITMSGNETETLSLYAVPVKDSDPSATIYEGDFTAGATVEMNYP